jgi:two-component system sensor histidine kinase YesM
MQTLILAFVAFLIVILVLALLLTGHYFFRPVQVLFGGMRKVQEGNFDVRLPLNSTYEFNYINQNFNKMIDNLQKLVLDNYTSKLVNKESQLRNIQNQLNEHFLYNTLDTIHWLARKEGAAQVCDIVFALAKFYRLSLSFGRDVISVSDVAEMLQNYLYIQEKRAIGALTHTIHYDEEIKNEMVLKHMLQPLVENAVIHGLNGVRSGGKIEISITKQNSEMHVVVSDNGKGFSKQQLEEVRRQLQLTDPYCDHSFALKTLQSQLQIYYGVEIHLTIDTEEGKGSTIWFDVPIYHTFKGNNEE